MLTVNNKNELKEVICIVDQAYVSLTNDFFDKYPCTMNFNKLQLSEAIKSNVFITTSLNYMKFMSDNSFCDEMVKLYSLDVRRRVKTIDSLHNKMEQYLANSNIQGKVIINKSINDLIGVRFLVKDLNDHLDDYIDFLKYLKNNNIITDIYRPYIKNKDTSRYIGLHVYLKDNNHHFPWEIQLWDPRSVEDNYSEHDKHESNRNLY